MEVKCIYVCSLSNKVMREKQIHNHDYVLLSDKGSCEIIFICSSCFLFFEAVFKPEFFFSRLKKMLFKKTRRDGFSGPINTIDLVNKKLKYLKGDIVIGHCKGHNCIILFFHFEGFYTIVPKKHLL